MMAFLGGLRNLGPARLGIMAAVAVISLGLLSFLALRDTTGPMALLYADLDLREAGQMAEQLDKAHIPHHSEANGSRMLVPLDQVDRARLLLAKEGLPSGGSVGNEIFDRSDGLTANSFQQQITQTRALEGELSRTIKTIQGIRNARVHLVLPRREPFARERQEAQASVVLTMAGVARLDRDGVQAILNLIAAAVPGLRPQNIAVIDSRGNLLARAGEAVGPAAAVQSGEELKRGTEQRLSRAVEEMLESSLGTGHVRAETAVEFDFNQVRETQEKFDPEGQVVRSTQTSTENSRNTEESSTVSVQNNLPNANAAATQPGGSQQQKQDETTNYEIGKTVRTIVREQPQIKRISLAVMVDGVTTRNADGTTGWAERSPEELARMTGLVRSAIGYNEQRGDHVEVVSMRFAAADAGPESPAPSLLSRIDQGSLIHLAENALIGLVVLATLLFVLRPMALRVAVAGKDAKPIAAADAAMALPGNATAGQIEGSAPGAAAPAMVQVANVEGPMRTSSVRRVTTLIDERPDESLAMLRNWLAEAN